MIGSLNVDATTERIPPTAVISGREKDHTVPLTGDSILKDAEKNISVSKKEIVRVSRNMNFLTQIMLKLHLNQKQLSKRTGYSEQVISHWMVADDCRLSTIMNVFNKLELEICCSYSPLTENKFNITTDAYDVSMEGVRQFTDEEDRTEKENVLANVIRSQARMSFLARHIMDMGYGLKPFCKSMNLQYDMVYHWFYKDDIRISRIYSIARMNQQKVNWTVKQITKVS